jgi:hypothetical protein
LDASVGRIEKLGNPSAVPFRKEIFIPRQRRIYTLDAGPRSPPKPRAWRPHQEPLHCYK